LSISFDFLGTKWVTPAFVSGAQLIPAEMSMKFVSGLYLAQRRNPVTTTGLYGAKVPRLNADLVEEL